MNLKKIKKILFFSIHFNILIMTIVVLYLVSSFVYLITPSRLEPQILYYYVYLEKSALFIPEMRNMPKARGEIQNFFSLKAFNKDSIEALIHELMLGPQNIYAKPFSTRYLTLDKVLFPSKKKVVYIKLIEKDEDIPENIEEKTKQWFEKNIRKYFDVDDIFVVIEKK